ncbi:MAG TPA: DUF885 domain-containing protein [Myxococcaceae bacterium]|nr:DUF885 domain-containing protein [Myxococcaceae bacterium]
MTHWSRVFLLMAPLLTSEPLAAGPRPSPALAALLAEDWQHHLSRSPTYASILGDRRWNDRWDDLSAEGIEADHQHDVAFLKQLGKMTEGKLSEADRLNAELIGREHRERIEAHALGLQFLPLNHMRGLPEVTGEFPGVQNAGQLAGQLRFFTVEDYRDWVARLDGFGAYVDQTIALLREGVKRQKMWPRVVLERIPPQLDALIAAAPRATPFYAPFTAMPDSLPEAERRTLSQTAERLIRERVQPAYRRLRDFVVGTYLPAAPTEVGVGRWPDGQRLYASCVRRYTTTDITPEQAHQLGLSEVARLRAELEAVKARAGFKGTLAEYFQYLKTDPRYVFRNGDELLLHTRDLAKRIDPKLIRLFGTLPRAPYGVEPTPAAMAPDATTGFYYPGAEDGSRAGTYWVNTYKPETRPRWELVPLTLHEAVPGHHLQVALAAEQQDLPAFRRYRYDVAYGEGWGLYSESLADELGLVDDPADKAGQLTYEMWRAVRLVVDTGMHVKGWTRAQAIRYFLENTPRQELDVTNEVDRYIAHPGQALAYKVGQLKIRELRTRAEKALGSRFDVRAFHDAVLLQGSLPMDVLEGRIDGWITAQQKAR